MTLEAFYHHIDERAEDVQRLANTERSIAFLRGVVVGCFTTLFSVALAYCVWRMIHG